MDKKDLKKEEKENNSRNDKKEIPKADNAGKLVSIARSKDQNDLHTKNKVTGAEFEGPPY